MDYRYGSHTVYNIEYHFVWVTKYRDKVLTGDVALGTSLRAEPRGQLSYRGLTTGLRPVSGLSVHMTNPPA